MGFDGTISSTVPIGAGLSSSAALTVSVGLALCRVADFELPPLGLARIAQAAGVDDVAARRLRHVVSENERVRKFFAALEQPVGPDLKALGALFRESHESLRSDVEVSTPELDRLVDLAYESGGFGGSIVALAEADRAPSLVAAVTTGYAASVDREATGYICASVDGAGDAEPESVED